MKQLMNINCDIVSIAHFTKPSHKHFCKWPLLYLCEMGQITSPPHKESIHRLSDCSIYVAYKG